MKRCPYCRKEIPRFRRTCKDQSCLEAEVRDFSLDYPKDSVFIFNDYSLESNFGRYSEGTYMRVRHNVE